MIKITLKTAIPIILSLLLVSCGSEPKPKRSNYEGSQWSSQSKIVYEFPNELKSKIEYSVLEIIDHLNKDVFGRELIVASFVNYDYEVFTASMDNKNRFHYLESSHSYIESTFSASTIAVALVWSRGSEVIEADLVFRNEGDNFYHFENYHAGPASGFDFWSVLIHEMGHSLGLDHDDSQDGKVMKSSISKNDTSRRFFSSFEVDKLRSIYK